MFNSTALDVVIGLVFIYLLYSLLATVTSEIIATQLGLRARNLKEAIDRMLNDEKEMHWWQRLWDSMKLMKNPDNEIINNFYNNPEIKYLGSSGIFRTPSSFKAISFSKTLVSVLFGNGLVDREKIEVKLKEIIQNAEEATIQKQNEVDRYEGNADEKDKMKKVLDPETARYIQSLWDDASGDVLKFKLQLEGWFDRTMIEATEWYKRKIRIVTFIVGFCIAWFFGADTLSIVKKLSTDSTARDQIVKMADAYVINNKSIDNTQVTDTLILKNYNHKLDSLLDVKEDLDAHITNASTILGMGAWLPDTIKVIHKNHGKIYIPEIDAFFSFSKAALKDTSKKNDNVTFITPIFCDKLGYLFYLFYHHFWGFIITAIAISLGAPFWFDVLNKVMSLRTSSKEVPDTSSKSTENNRPITINLKNQTSDEAVG